MQEMLGLGRWLSGKSTCCASMRTRVRIPTVHNEKPGVSMCAYNPGIARDGERKIEAGTSLAVSLSPGSEKPCLEGIKQRLTE